MSSEPARDQNGDGLHEQKHRPRLIGQHKIGQAAIGLLARRRQIRPLLSLAAKRMAKAK